MQYFSASGEIFETSARVIDSRVIGSGLSGKGCVGHAASPSASVGGTGRSSTPKIGSPVSRLRKNSRPTFVICTIAGICWPLRVDLGEHRRRVEIAVVDVVVRGLEVPPVFAGRGVERDHARRVEVGARAGCCRSSDRRRCRARRTRGRSRCPPSAAATSRGPCGPASRSVPRCRSSDRRAAARCGSATLPCRSADRSRADRRECPSGCARPCGPERSRGSCRPRPARRSCTPRRPGMRSMMPFSRSMTPTSGTSVPRLRVELHELAGARA